MNRSPNLNPFLVGGPDTAGLGSITAPPLLRAMRPATFGLWALLAAIEGFQVFTTGEMRGFLMLFLSTALLVVVHVQFWYEESQRGRQFHRAIERVRGRIYEDETTGLPNSRHFVFELRRQMMRSVRSGRGFALILTDLTGLQPKEEQLLLPSIGKALRHAIGDGDFVAHLEGTVFAAVVVDDNERTIADKADAVFNSLAASIPLERASGVRPVVALTGYQGELEVRDLLRRGQRDLLGARTRGGPVSASARRTFGAA